MEEKELDGHGRCQRPLDDGCPFEQAFVRAPATGRQCERPGLHDVVALDRRDLLRLHYVRPACPGPLACIPWLVTDAWHGEGRGAGVPRGLPGEGRCSLFGFCVVGDVPGGC